MPRPKKTHDSKLAAYIKVMMTAEQRALFDASAERAGQSLSDWVRTRLLAAAKAETEGERRGA